MKKPDRPKNNLSKNNLPVRVPRNRALSDDEIDLWIAVARSITPRPGRAKLPARSEKAPDPSLPEMPKPAPVPPPAPAIQKPPTIPSLNGVERRLKYKLNRDRNAVDAVLDLHGMHQAAAFSTLRNFLSNAQMDGAKLVLVITGKGERQGASLFEGGGVLRRSVPHWLAAPEMRSIVVGFEEAARPHGGAGALLIQIRRYERAKSRFSQRYPYGE